MLHSSAALKELGLVNTRVVWVRMLFSYIGHLPGVQLIAAVGRWEGLGPMLDPDHSWTAVQMSRLQIIWMKETVACSSDMKPQLMQFSSVQFSSCSHSVTLNFVSVVFLTEIWVYMSYLSAIFHNVWFDTSMIWTLMCSGTVRFNSPFCSIMKFQADFQNCCQFSTKKLKWIFCYCICLCNIYSSCIFCMWHIPKYFLGREKNDSLCYKSPKRWKRAFCKWYIIGCK